MGKYYSTGQVTIAYSDFYDITAYGAQGGNANNAIPAIPAPQVGPEALLVAPAVPVAMAAPAAAPMAVAVAAFPAAMAAALTPRARRKPVAARGQDIPAVPVTFPTTRINTAKAALAAAAAVRG